MSVTHRRLTCSLTCGGNKMIGVEDAYDCALQSTTVLLNTPCEALSSTAPTTAAGSTTASAADDNSDTTVIIIIVVIVVAVVLAIFITVAAVMFRRGKQAAPVSNVSVVIENKTTERPAKTKSSKAGKVAMGIPDDGGYPSEAGGTASLNYPEEASSVPNVDYAHSGAPSEAGYGKSGAQGYPPQIGDSSDESSGPPA